MKIKCHASPMWGSLLYRLRAWARRTWHTFLGHVDWYKCEYLIDEWYCNGCKSFLVPRGTYVQPEKV